MNPNPDPSPMNRAKRCRATSKRSGKRCRSPAVRGWTVCRVHGAGGGAPPGNSNALKHGLYTNAAGAERQQIATFIRDAKTVLNAIDAEG